jgi:hypothetical protein
MEDLNPLVVDLVDLLDPDLRERFEDQIAVIQHIGEAPRVLAECFALLSLLHQYPGALLGVSLLEFEVGGERRWLLTRDVAAARARLDAMAVGRCRVVDLHGVLWREYGGMATLARF